LHLQPFPLFMLSGVTPFGTIFLETYIIFSSFWRYKVYYLYGFMLAVGGMLCVVTGCVAIVVVYALLNAEDWSWQWKCWLAGGSAAIYVYVYSIFFYYQKTRYICAVTKPRGCLLWFLLLLTHPLCSMSGTFQTTFLLWVHFARVCGVVFDVRQVHGDRRACMREHA